MSTAIAIEKPASSRRIASGAGFVSDEARAVKAPAERMPAERMLTPRTPRDRLKH